VITNQGAGEQEFEILYHTNFGRPLLEEGATLVAAIDRITPFNAHAAKTIGSHARYAGPTQGFIEQVYCIRPLADAEGHTVAMLQNARKDRAASIAFSVRELPYLTQWKNTAAAADGYVTGIEPGTNFPYNRRIERQFGRVPKLAAGARRSFTIHFAIHRGGAEVRAVADRIAALQGGRSPHIDAQAAEPK
jgi:Domain of unknown function (DUF4432)